MASMRGVKFTLPFLLWMTATSSSANGFGQRRGVPTLSPRNNDVSSIEDAALFSASQSVDTLGIDDGGVDNARGRRISPALLAMVGGRPSDYDEFMDHVWQKTPRVYRRSNADDPDGNAYTDQINMGIPGLVRALTQGCKPFRTTNFTPDWHKTLPMIFDAEKTALEIPQIASLYGGGPEGSEASEPLFAAYLDGRSVVLNHCDRLCPRTAALCEDLQGAFPVAYANAYLTPPASQTVHPHADDRDVFVVQVHGEKTWRVYREVPIPYPYPNEQVGKNGMPVPDRVLRGDLAVETVLRPGDVLYIPRGWVHEATTRGRAGKDANNNNKAGGGGTKIISPSYHVTIALATFDWSLSQMLATATKMTLDDVPEHRMAMPLDLGAPVRPDGTFGPTTSTRRALEAQIDRALEAVRREWKADAIDQYMRQKYEWHRGLSRPERDSCIEEWRKEEFQRMGDGVIANGAASGSDAAVGVNAAKRLQSMSSIIRASTPEEQASVSLSSAPLPHDRQQKLRAETKEALESITQTLQTMGSSHTMEISQLPSLLKDQCPYICDLTLISYVRQCVERGEMATG
mmetsp:Transcript_20852/g.60698  ORF Transcript_20852/g.60698 Transcript_20852/m.60698 type:complete len:573 (-) Transcript_20852:274-1992(-)